MTARPIMFEEELNGPRDSQSDERTRYLSSHRALTACSRELARLAGDVKHLIDGIRAPEDEFSMRVTPGRCIVQVAGVALTISWLRSTLDSVADGRLLVVAWRGTVGGGATRAFERAKPPAERRAEPLWEEVLVADATGDGDWHWSAEADPTLRFDSRALAERCVQPLRTALAATREAPADSLIQENE